MIAELGLGALWLAAALALLQLLVAMGIAGRESAAAARPVAMVQGALALAAFAALIAVFLSSDLSVALVAANSHSAKPWIYKFAGAWGNHEGSMLLWVTVLALSGGALALFEQRISERMMAASLGAQVLDDHRRPRNRSVTSSSARSFDSPPCAAMPESTRASAREVDDNPA